MRISAWCKLYFDAGNARMGLAFRNTSSRRTEAHDGDITRPRVSVVIPTHNRKELLRECLTSLFNQTYSKEGYEIIVVDDGSTDGTEGILRDLMRSSESPLHYFTQDNKGAATARNLGIGQAEGDIIASIDDDCIASKTWIENAVPYFRDEQIVGVQGQTLPAEAVRLRFLPPRFSRTMEITGGTWNRQTCNIFYRRQALLDIGGFNEQFKMTGAEDADLAFRIEEIGRIAFSQEVVVYHAVFYDTLTDRLRFMRRYQYEPILFKEHPHLRKNLLFGFVYSKEVVHAPFFVLAGLVGLLGGLWGVSLLPAAGLAVMWVIVYLWSNVLVDRNARHFPLRMALAPVKLLLHSTKLYFHLLGSLKYKSLIV